VGQLNLRRDLLKVLTVNIILISTVMYIPFTQAQTDYGNIILSGSDSMTIMGNALCDNLTISDDATLIVEDGYLRVRGIVRLSENARFFIIRSTVRLDPPPLNDSTIILHAIGNSMINVKESSTLLFRPQPTATNISYMLMEDYSSLFLVDSVFSGDLPSIINQSIEVAAVTAGVYLLSGYASWYMKNSDVSGRLSFTSNELTGRWFWCSLHQRSTLTIENTDIQLTGALSPSFTLLKPVSGVTTIKNSRVLGGMVDGEVTAELILENSSFNYKVEFKDQTKAKISNCTFHNDVIIGSALSFVEVEGAPETNIEMSNSTLKGNIRCEANSTTSIKDTTIRSLNVKDNASIDIKNTAIEFIASIKDYSYANIQSSNVSLYNIDDTAYVNIFGSEKILEIYLYSPDEHVKKETMFINGAQIEYIQFDTNCSNSLSFENVIIDKISFYNDINVTLQLINSSIEILFPWESGENVTLNFIDIYSTLPDLSAQNKNISFRVYHRLEVIVSLNGKPIETWVKAGDDLGHEWVGLSHFGKATFDLPYKYIHDQTVEVTQSYTIITSFLGFTDSKDLVLSSSQTIIFTWVDDSPPKISNISYTPAQWNMGSEITVSASVVDQGVMVIKSVTLFYCIDDGDWSELQMFKVGENRYETSIPEQGKNCRTTFYISTEDMADNSVDSDMQEFTIGEEENILIYGSVIALIIIIAILLIRQVFIYRKIKKYTTKLEFKEMKK
jgi:hypothetical protein